MHKVKSDGIRSIFSYLELGDLIISSSADKLLFTTSSKVLSSWEVLYINWVRFACKSASINNIFKFGLLLANW